MNNYYQPESKWSKLTPEQWKVILDKEQRKIYGFADNVEIIDLTIKID